MFGLSGQHQMPVQPMAARRERCEAHPRMERDPGPLGKHVDRSEGRQHRQHPFEGSTYGGILAVEVCVN